ncbi:hypothetical protein PybrP1_011259 [[Pythium] brassicae (nom. inval.)]|nr:hypothetical protein PybrP1_011259 [[Pythium] brassicae (nom. inval.)]
MDTGTAHQLAARCGGDGRRIPSAHAEMFDVVADVDRYHEFLPFCVDSRVLRRPNDNVMEAALRVGFKVFTESYTSRVIMKRPEKIVIKSIESPTFKRIESQRTDELMGELFGCRGASEWAFHSTEDPNSCVIDFKVTFEVASFLHANAIQLFFDDVAVAQLSAFVERARRVYSSRTARAAARAPAAGASPPRAEVKVAAPPRVSQGESTYPIPSSLAGTMSHLSGLSAAQRAAESKAQSLFHAIDTLCDGKISREELTTAMQRRIRTVKKIFPVLLRDQDEWLYAWQTHPEFVELMTVDGMKKFAQWASVVHPDNADAAEALDTRLTHVD